MQRKTKTKMLPYILVPLSKNNEDCTFSDWDSDLSFEGNSSSETLASFVSGINSCYSNSIESCNSYNSLHSVMSSSSTGRTDAPGENELVQKLTVEFFAKELKKHDWEGPKKVLMGKLPGGQENVIN